MLKRLSLLLLLAVTAAAWGQSPRSAVGGEGSIWAGGEVSTFNPDYSCASNLPFNCSDQLIGVGAFFDVNLRARYGAEGEARWMDWHGPGGQSESNYLLGPRYRFFQHHRLSGWGKIMFGGGWITTPYYPQAGSLRGSYFVYAPGGTLSYRLTSHLAVRGDYEYQIWPSFSGPQTFTGGTVIDHNHGLTPNGFSLGVAWRFLGQ